MRIKVVSSAVITLNTKPLSCLGQLVYLTKTISYGFRFRSQKRVIVLLSNTVATTDSMRLNLTDALRVSKQLGGCMAMRSDEKVTKL